MATRISFSTTYPDRMGPLRGKFTRFPEKLITMIDPGKENMELDVLIFQLTKDGFYDFDFKVNYIPKTTTIRSNYEYWKSKEGQLIQPFFWAGKPYRSKHVVFCPEVRLKRVRKIETNREKKWVLIGGCNLFLGTTLKPIIQGEGFDHPNHFWMWFNEDFDGALLELESAKQ